MAQKKLVNTTVKEYVQTLASKKPAPGGGSAAALTGALGSSLIGMSAQYSVGKSESVVVNRKINAIINQAGVIQKRFIELVDLDAQAYANLVKAKKQDKRTYAKALKEANAIPKEIVKLSMKAVELTSYLAEHGNKYLLSDVEAAAHMLLASCSSAKAMIEANQ